MFSLKARWVLPIDRPPLELGVVTIDQGRILEVVPSGSSHAGAIDLGDVVLMPGLVNAHTHLEFSDLAVPLGRRGISLPEWIRGVIAERKRSSREAQAAVALGMQESILRGVTTIGEIATLPASAYETPGSARWLTLFHEAIGFSAARVDSVLSDVTQRLNNSRESKSRRSADTGAMAFGLSPHAPYTVNPQLLEKLIRLAHENQLPVAMHLAESPEELKLLAKGEGPFRTLLEERSMWDPAAIPSGSRPLDYLQQLAKAPRALVVHGNYLARNEMEFVAARRDWMSIVYCPRTHAYFEHDRYPLGQMLAAGVRVVLGTDSRASNPDLCLLGEMRHLASLHPDVLPEHVLEMGTLRGAESLGLENNLGSLASGKLANLLTIPCEKRSCDPYEAVLQSTAAPGDVWLQGERREGDL